MELVDPSKLPLKAVTKSDCKDELTQLRWQESGFRCPTCGNDKAYWLRKRELYECANKKCKKQTSATAGTQFQGLRKLAELWHVMSIQREEKNGISSGRIKQTTGLNYKSARKMIERLEHCRRMEHVHAKFKERQKSSNIQTQNRTVKHNQQNITPINSSQKAAVFRTSHRHVSLSTSRKTVHISFYFARTRGRETMHVVKAI